MIRRLSSQSSVTAPRVSKLRNGIRIASLPAPGSHFMSLGVFIDSGTRNETEATAGFTHILDRMAFKSTKSFGTEDLVKEIEGLGGNISAQSGRESVMFQAAIFNKDLEKTIRLFSSIVKEPLLLPDEVKHVCESSMFELDDLQHNMDNFMPEILHKTAYRSLDGNANSYGHPLLGSRERLANVSVDELIQFRETWFTPERIVIAGVGMEHEVLGDLVERYFGDIPPSAPEVFRKQLQQVQPVHYTGGLSIIDSSKLPPNPNPDEYPFSHMHIAFESMSMTDPDIYAIATLASLLGGGGSFSAGGPGKGMYSRLYTDVLNRYHWIESANKIHHSYFKSGLFGISVSVPPIKDAHEAIISIVCDQLAQATNRIPHEDFNRAKNQLKSNILMDLESKLVLVEDIGRQILMKGTYTEPNEIVKRIEMLEPKDLERAARRVILSSDEKSPLNFEGCTPDWERTGKGEPTIVIRGKLFGGDRDPFHRVEKVMKQWGIGRPISFAKKVFG